MDINTAITRLDWTKEPQGLYEPIAYTLASGGKRLRPTLALLAAELFGGKEEDVGRYVLMPAIFDILEKTAPGRNNEIQLTDGMRALCRREPMCAVDAPPCM